MTDEPTSVSGSIDRAEVEAAQLRARQFATNLMYDAQFREIVPLIEELEDFDENDYRAKLINSVLEEALKNFPLRDEEI